MNIAIVTVTYNDKKNLQRTFKSIRKYKKEYHKYFVIDGNSSDGTLDEIKCNFDIIDDYISEPDTGIYDAMNKALEIPIEDNSYILWLNAGDELLDWKDINIGELKNYDCAFFAVLTKMDIADNPVLATPQIMLPYNVKNFVPVSRFKHQGFLIKRKIFEDKLYNTEVGLQAENLLMSQCILNNTFLISHLPISTFYLDGTSFTNFKLVHKSYLNVADLLGFKKSDLYLNHKYSTFKYFVKTLLPLKLITTYVKIKRKLWINN